MVKMMVEGEKMANCAQGRRSCSRTSITLRPAQRTACFMHAIIGDAVNMFFHTAVPAFQRDRDRGINIRRFQTTALSCLSS